MADNYEDQHGAPEGEHEAEHAVENETWQDDQPPVDDFADHAPEETATVSEEEMPVETEEHAQAARKTSPLLPVIAGLGGLLFLGALLYWQFGSNSNIPSYQEQPLKMPQQSAVMNSALTPTTPGNATSNVGANPTDTTDISSLKQPDPDVAPTSALAPVADVPPPVTPVAPVAVAPVVPAKTTVTTTTTVAPAPAAAPVAPVSPVVAAAPVAAPTPAPVVGTAAEARLNALAAQVEELQKQLMQTNQQLNQANSQLASVNEKAAAAPEVAAPVYTAPKHVAHTPAAPAKHKTTTYRAVAHEVPAPTTASTSGTLQVPTSATVASSAPATHWVLRAATPTEAWVAANATTPELRHVQKGDDLPGIGRIRAIRQTSTGWMIEGSQGNLQ